MKYYSFHEYISLVLSQYFPLEIRNIIMIFVKYNEFLSAKDEHMIDCNYFRIESLLGDKLPDLKNIIYYNSEYTYNPHYIYLFKRFKYSYWRHIDNDNQHDNLLVELKLYSPDQIALDFINDNNLSLCSIVHHNIVNKKRCSILNNTLNYYNVYLHGWNLLNKPNLNSSDYENPNSLDIQSYPFKWIRWEDLSKKKHRSSKKKKYKSVKNSYYKKQNYKKKFKNY